MKRDQCLIPLVLLCLAVVFSLRWVGAGWQGMEERREVVPVPILMYHGLAEPSQGAAGGAVRTDQFQAHLDLLTQKGYTPILYDDLRRFVLQGQALPEKPVILTFDDGYRNNLTLAAPLLRQHGFCGEIAVIGCSVGKDTYKDTGRAITPHFSLAEALPWVEGGVLSLHSHSYDMHQVNALDGADCRVGALPLPNESPQDYAAAFARDRDQVQALLAQIVPRERGEVFTYPYGDFSDATEAVLRDLQVPITVTTARGIARPVKGMPKSLKLLPRFDIGPETSAQDLLEMLEG